MTIEVLERLTDLDLRLIEMSEEELDSFATLSARATERRILDDGCTVTRIRRAGVASRGDRARRFDGLAVRAVA